MLDDRVGTWLYGDTVAIHDGAPQVVRVRPNRPVRVRDSRGAGAGWFVEMVGTSCVFDYRYTG